MIQPIRKKILLIILFIYSLSFLLFIIHSFAQTHGTIKQMSSMLNSNINNLYTEATDKMLKKSLEHQATVFFKFINKNKFLSLLRTQDSQQLKVLLSHHYEWLKNELPTFNTLEIITPNGVSLLRMHAEKLSGDDLTRYRSHIKQIVKSPRTEGYYEAGKYGLLYRHITPIYEREKLMGFIEMGMAPSLLINKINRVFGVQGFVFVKDHHIDSMIDSPIRIGDYTLCTYCSDLKSTTQFSAEHFKLKKHHYKVDVNDRQFEVIQEPIYDGFHNEIGKILFFKNISFIYDELKAIIIRSLVFFLFSLLLTFVLLNHYLNAILRKLIKAQFLLDNINDSVIVIDPITKKIIDANRHAIDMLGYTLKELQMLTVRHITEDYERLVTSTRDERINTLRVEHTALRKTYTITKDGSRIPIEAKLSYIQNGNEEFIVSVGRDIRQQLKLTAQIEQQHRELTRLNDVISETVLYTTCNLDNKITYVSKAFERFTGFSEQELLGKSQSDLHHQDMPPSFFQEVYRTIHADQTFKGEMKCRKKDGSPYWVNITVKSIIDSKGQKFGYACYREDITSQKELEYFSSHDQLTQLYNRFELETHLSKKIKSAERYQLSFGFILCDIDHFKLINDEYGHQIGDLALTKIADVFKATLRADDFVARWGGEEFVIITPQSSMDDLTHLVNKLQQSISQTAIRPTGNLTLSYGLTVYQAGDSADSILQRADQALYQAKNNGRNRYEIA